MPSASTLFLPASVNGPKKRETDPYLWLSSASQMYVSIVLRGLLPNARILGGQKYIYQFSGSEGCATDLYFGNIFKRAHDNNAATRSDDRGREQSSSLH